ncbi:MAG: class I SAM-dependent methyltransferase [Syntrophomonadaceae bacterium]
MKIIKKNMIDLAGLKDAIKKPEIYQKSTCKFWDDEHISGEMLKFHLNPDVEAASKTRKAIEAETGFIISYTGMNASHSVIDLGCGPGLYVREFARTGAEVTGVDLSPNSINYTLQHIKPEFENVRFINMNYLDMDFAASFDIATMIFYDFCVLNPDEQNRLLNNIHRALKSNGVFIFDVVTVNRKVPESTSISICDGGFWSPEPYIEIMNTCLYEDQHTEGMQYTIIAKDGTTRIIRLYHRLFNRDDIEKLLAENGFEMVGIYNNLQGEALSEGTETFGIIARKV